MDYYVIFIILLSILNVFNDLNKLLNHKLIYSIKFLFTTSSQQNDIHKLSHSTSARCLVVDSLELISK